MGQGGNQPKYVPICTFFDDSVLALSKEGLEKGIFMGKSHLRKGRHLRKKICDKNSFFNLFSLPLHSRVRWKGSKTLSGGGSQAPPPHPRGRGGVIGPPPLPSPRASYRTLLQRKTLNFSRSQTHFVKYFLGGGGQAIFSFFFLRVFPTSPRQLFLTLHS